jgi:hypothetical protein
MRTYRPMGYFGAFSAILILISAAFFIPVFLDYLKTGIVLRFPTLIVCGFTFIAALQSFFAGLQLSTIYQKNRQDFELELYKVMNREREKKSREGVLDERPEAAEK